MNVWQMSSDQRLKEWRVFRNEILEIDDDIKVLKLVADWWKLAPISTRAIDVYDDSTWPNPWDLIHKGELDENAIALGMCYTLQLIDWPCTLQLIQDNEQNEIKLIILVDDEHVLNYTYNEVIDNTTISHCSIINQWESSDLI